MFEEEIGGRKEVSSGIVVAHDPSFHDDHAVQHSHIQKTAEGDNPHRASEFVVVIQDNMQHRILVRICRIHSRTICSTNPGLCEV